MEGSVVLPLEIDPTDNTNNISGIYNKDLDGAKFYGE